MTTLHSHVRSSLTLMIKATDDILTNDQKRIWCIMTTEAFLELYKSKRRKVFLPYKILILMWWSLRPILVLWLAAKTKQKPLMNPVFTRCSEQSNLSSLHFWVWICAFFPFLLLTLFSQRQELYIWCFWVVQTFCGSPAWTEGKQQKTINCKSTCLLESYAVSADFTIWQRELRAR